MVFTTSTDGAVIEAAEAGVGYRVTRYHMMASGPVTVQFLSNSTPISGKKYLAMAGSGAAGQATEDGHFQTNRGEALILSLSAGVEVSMDLDVERF